MKFAIFRELKKGKRKFLVEWDQDEILDKVCDYLEDRIHPLDIPIVNDAFEHVIMQFKKESIRIP